SIELREHRAPSRHISYGPTLRIQLKLRNIVQHPVVDFANCAEGAAIHVANREARGHTARSIQTAQRAAPAAVRDLDLGEPEQEIHAFTRDGPRYLVLDGRVGAHVNGAGLSLVSMTRQPDHIRIGGRKIRL